MAVHVAATGISAATGCLILTPVLPVAKTANRTNVKWPGVSYVDSHGILHTPH